MPDLVVYRNRCKLRNWRSLRLEICRGWLQTHPDSTKDRALECTVQATNRNLQGTSWLMSCSMQSTPGCCQVPIHTVTLDVQDHEKTQQLPTQLPKDFQEVTTLSFSRICIAHFPCSRMKALLITVRLHQVACCHAVPDLLDACRLTFY